MDARILALLVPVAAMAFPKVTGSLWREQLSGGLADGRTPGDFDPVELARGIEVELEHTNDRDLAMEIAMDHLIEDPKYYVKLAKMEGHANRRRRR